MLFRSANISMKPQYLACVLTVAGLIGVFFGVPKSLSDSAIFAGDDGGVGAGTSDHSKFSCKM